MDFVVVRELTGGIYFGAYLEDQAWDINGYSVWRMEGIVRKAFEIAQGRAESPPALISKDVLATSSLEE